MKKIVLCSLLLVSPVLQALTCEQSASIALADTHEHTMLMAEKFAQIKNIEVIPQQIKQQAGQIEIEQVQILMCGELKSTMTQVEPTPGQPCNFDSDCMYPLRCEKNRCVFPQPDAE